MKKILFLVLLFFASTENRAQVVKPDAPSSLTQQEATKLNSEVVRLFRQQKFEEALPLAQKILEIREREVGKNHLLTGQSWINLAHIQQQRGKSDEAKKAFETAFEIYESNQPLLAADEKAFTDLLDITAIYQANEGKYEKAEKRLERALELKEKSFGKDSLESGDGLYKLGQIRQLEGEYGKSAPLFVRALEIRAAKLGNANDGTRDVFNNAVCSLTKLGEEKQADELRAKFYASKSDDLPIEGKTSVIQGGIINGKALVLAKPSYPAEARAARAQGAVLVQVTIDETGNIVFACAIKGARELHRASEAAAYRSKFAPTVLDGKPVKVSGVIVYNFKI